MSDNRGVLIRLFSPDGQHDVDLAPGLPLPMPGDSIRTFEAPSLNPMFWRVLERHLSYEGIDEVHVGLRVEKLHPREIGWMG